MKRLIAVAAILLPHFVITPFWYFKTFDLSAWLPLSQALYSGLIGPLAIGIYGMWEIFNQKEKMWNVALFCLLLALFGVFVGYANWGLSSGYFLNPDLETQAIVLLEGSFAIITIVLLLTVGWIITKIKRKPNTRLDPTGNKPGAFLH